MSEGPVSFGKPLLWLVILGCIGGGYYAYTHWPVSYDGGGWSVDFPNKWEATPFNDPASPGKVVAKGPLPEEVQGVGWATINFHGTLDWPGFVVRNVPGTMDTSEDTEIAHKKALMFTYEDASIRYLGAGVQRGDAVVIVAVGCAKANFAANRSNFEKILKSIRCNR